MTLTYKIYKIEEGIASIVSTGRKTINEKEHGARYFLKKMFPRFDFSKMANGNYVRMHDQNWEYGIAVDID